ncbi:Mevalonate kinase [Hyunsoonleella jejuensis]|uniref:Mevalonate kinase n=1 Tax=Hyunsoonleella jejuensis TaxID=419940 RepID=A0A1H9CR81_9FLAO|nr:GYDIA family GHMP kinase [Hyunsoonleella jejuensis]SEQ03674.1 Mevalonate kinase [Hyunsoonleella jejuensis]
MNSSSQTFRSNGKLLLTGEYVVLDGAIALAAPTKQGQSLYVETIIDQKIHWKSFDENGNCWFDAEFNTVDFEVLKHTSTGLNTSIQHINIAQRLKQILSAVNTLNPDFLNTHNGYKVETHLDFPNNWGLGTSSTLINNIAQWANVDAFKLLELTFGGSGYDIACAQHNTAITYQLLNGTPIVKPVVFNPSFKNHLYFVYLNKKQNSRDGIAHYKTFQQDLGSVISDITTITTRMISCENLKEFQELLFTHEQVISKIIRQDTVTSILFSDFDGALKSLGAWGGDFILAASEQDPSSYFIKKGFHTVIPYRDMIL